MRQLRLGMRGERMIGHMLEALRADGYEVFHDIPGNGFNVDHVLIGPSGIFAIETKTISMPSKRKAVIDYDGTNVVIDGPPDRNPVSQAKAEADFIRDLMKRMTARDVTVRPVVLYPGWWINQKTRDCRTWVLNPRAMPKFLKNEPRRFSREDIALFSERLTQHLCS